MYDPAVQRQVNRIYGVVIAIVTNNQDPEGRYRVKVKYPWVMDSNPLHTDNPDQMSFVSNWARIANQMSGSGIGQNFRGAYWLPEPDDEVLVMFEHGDIRHPIVIGSLWNGYDKPIHDNSPTGPQTGRNNFRSWRSRSGHMLTFQDDKMGNKEKIIIQTKIQDGEEHNGPMSRDGHMIVIDHSMGEEKIQIYDRKKENFVLIDSTQNHITTESTNGDITIRAPQGTVTIECKTLVTKSSETTEMSAGTNYSQESGNDMNMTAGTNMNQKASTINLN
jgi:uncharacterized protein involved in type VI secretion and phage assembly